MEVQPYQTRTDKVYMALQRGDEEMSEKKPLQYRLFDGMPGMIDPQIWTTPPCLSSYNQGETLWVELDRTKENLNFLNNAVQPINNNVTNPKTEMNYFSFRRCKNFIDLKDIADLPEVKKAEPDLMLKVRTHKKRIPVLKIKRLPKNLVKDSSIIDIMREPIVETGQITIGLYTVGPAGGDHYPTYSGVGGFVAAIGANQTGNLIGQNTGSITEAAVATIIHNLAGFIFDICSNVDHLGNYNNGHLITVAQNSQMFNMSTEQAGTVNVRLLKFIRIVIASASSRAFVLTSNTLAAGQVINVYRNLGDCNSLGGCFYRTSDRDHIVNVFANMGWNGDYGILLDAADGNANNVYENNSFYNNSVAGIDASDSIVGGTFRNNACLGNAADYLNLGGATIGRNNADSDGTAADGNWGGAGSGNQINLVTAAQWESLLHGDGDPFLRPLAGSTLDTAGIGATYATTLINGVPQLVTIGAKGRIIPVPTGITHQSHTAISNTIAIM